MGGGVGVGGGGVGGGVGGLRNKFKYVKTCLNLQSNVNVNLNILNAI